MKPKHKALICPCCGKPIEGEPTDYGWQLPDEVWALGPEGRAVHLEHSDGCMWEGRGFVRGVLSVPCNNSLGSFGWGIWAELSETDYDYCADHCDEDMTGSPVLRGTIACELPVYEGTFGLPIDVQFGTPDQRPTFHMPTDCDHPLAIDYRIGMSDERRFQVLHAILPSS